MKGMLKGQMVDIISYKEIGENKTKMVLFKVADRLKRTVGKEQVSDFYLCKAYGRNAETIEKYFDIKDKDGKFKSRKIDMWGNLETYKGKMNITNIPMDVLTDDIFSALGMKVPKKFEGTEINLTKDEYEIDVTNFCYSVESIEFVDFVDTNEEGVVESNSSKINVSIKNKNFKDTPSDDTCTNDMDNVTSNFEQKMPDGWCK